jgi:hypothetical protein
MLEEELLDDSPSRSTRTRRSWVVSFLQENRKWLKMLFVTPDCHASLSVLHPQGVKSLSLT